MRTPEFWTANTTGAKTLRTLLSPLGALYGASVAWRRATTRPFRSDARVLCVGNLSVGGTGKTPVALTLAAMLEKLGYKVAFLTRGYGGKLSGPVLTDPAWHTAADVGDEPLLLAGVARTIVSRDRARGAHFADRMDVDIIVMDDGFQNFDIAKDASIVVVDSEAGFGNGHRLPAGPLREGIGGIERADAIVLMGGGPSPLPPTQVPVMRAHIEPADPAPLRGQRVVAFAGIGRPQKFFDMLARAGAEMLRTSAFPDHHNYTFEEMSRLRMLARQSTADLITTEKDYYRLPREHRDGITAVPIRVVFDDPLLVRRILEKVMPIPEEQMR